MTVHSDPVIEGLCPTCHPEREQAKRVKGQAFYDHMTGAWDEMGRDLVFTPEEKAAFFQRLQRFLLAEGYLGA